MGKFTIAGQNYDVNEIREVYKNTKDRLDNVPGELDLIFEVALQHDRFPVINMNDDQTTGEYIMRWVNGYCNAMNHLPSTRIMERKSSCTDPAIKVIVKTARGLSESEAEAGEVYHNLFMSAENIQGNLLEEYIASKVWQCTKRRCATTVLNLYPQWRIFRIRPKASSLKVYSKAWRNTIRQSCPKRYGAVCVSPGRRATIPAGASCTAWMPL